MNAEAEAAVIAGCLVDNRVVASACAALTPGEFHDQDRARAFAAIVALHGRQIPVTYASVLDELGRPEGGSDFLAATLDEHPGASGIAYHVRQVAEYARRRALVTELDEAREDAMKPGSQFGAGEIAQRLTLRLRSPDLATASGLPEPVQMLDTADAEPIRFQFQDLATQGEIMVLAGDGGSGKTTAALHLAAAAASGSCAFGRFPSLQCAVLIVSEEDGAAVIQNRLDAMVAGECWNREQVMGNIYVLAKHGARLQDVQWRAHLTATVERLQIKLVIFDPWRELNAGEENSSDATKEALGAVRAICAPTGATPLIVHHAGKAGADKRNADRVRGSSALLHASRAAYLFEEREGGSSVECLKMSRAEKPPRFELVRLVDAEPENRLIWRRATLTFKAAGAASASKAETLVISTLKETPGLSSTDLRTIGDDAGVSHGPISKALRDLETRGFIEAIDLGRNKKGWRICELAGLPGACLAGSPNPHLELAAPVGGKASSNGASNGDGKLAGAA